MIEVFIDLYSRFWTASLTETTILIPVYYTKIPDFYVIFDVFARKFSQMSTFFCFYSNNWPPMLFSYYALLKSSYNEEHFVLAGAIANR